MLRATRVHPEFGLTLQNTGLSPSMAILSRIVLLINTSIFFSKSLKPKELFRIFEDSINVPRFGRFSGCPTTPAGKPTGLGSSAFARRYLRNLFEFSSSGYLDVSVHQVPSSPPMYSETGHWTLLQRGFPIRTSADYHFCAVPRSFS